jgi:hypothetical protein
MWLPGSDDHSLATGPGHVHAALRVRVELSRLAGQQPSHEGLRASSPSTSVKGLYGFADDWPLTTLGLRSRATVRCVRLLRPGRDGTQGIAGHDDCCSRIEFYRYSTAPQSLDDCSSPALTHWVEDRANCRVEVGASFSDRDRGSSDEGDLGVSPRWPEGVNERRHWSHQLRPPVLRPSDLNAGREYKGFGRARRGRLRPSRCLSRSLGGGAGIHGYASGRVAPA